MKRGRNMLHRFRKDKGGRTDRQRVLCHMACIIMIIMTTRE